MIPARTVDVLVQTRCQLGEAPYWDSAGHLWFSDIDARRLYRYRWGEMCLDEVATEHPVCCIVPRARGGVVVAYDAAIAVGRWGELQEPIPVPLGRDVRFNDGGSDPGGRLFLGTTHREYLDGYGSLLRSDHGSDFQVMRSGLSISNGIVWTADGESMLHVDTLRRAITVYDYDAEAGALGKVRRVIDTSTISGVPDGCALDADGRLWVAFWGGGQVVVLDPAGRVVERVPLPVPHVTSCAFVGDDLDALAITTARPLGDFHELAGSVFVVAAGATGATLWSCTAL